MGPPDPDSVTLNDRGPDAPSSTRYVENIRNLLGLLLAGFVGTLNLIGLKSGEVASVLRNEGAIPIIIMFTLLASLLLAVGSVFVGDKQRVSPLPAICLLAFLLGFGTLTVFLVRIPVATRPWLATLSLIIGLGLMLASIVGALWYWHSRKQPMFWNDPDKVGPTSAGSSSSDAAAESRPKSFHVQMVLLAGGAILASVAIFAAVRLEIKSQTDATVPRMGANVDLKPGVGSLTLTIAASRLRSGDRLGLLIEGFPRAKVIADTCNDPLVSDKFNCGQQPCSYYPCEFLGDARVQPDESGVVSQTVTFLFSPTAYQHLHALVESCERARGHATCEFKSDKESEIDIRVPSP